MGFGRHMTADLIEVDLHAAVLEKGSINAAPLPILGQMAPNR